MDRELEVKRQLPGCARHRGGFNLLAALAASLLFIVTCRDGLAGPEGAFKSDLIDQVFQFTLAPSSITASPDGGWILGVSQAERPLLRAVKVAKSGKVDPFPTDAMSEAAAGEALPLDAVQGLQLDGEGLVWMLDNGRRSESVPKIISWNAEKRRLVQVLHLGQPAIVPGSFLADLAVDPNEPFIYISDPASGADAALIVVDRITGLARRVLQGDSSVVPDETLPLKAGRDGIAARRIDGRQVLPHCGVDPIALDRKGEWLYFAPLRSAFVHRIRTAVLRSGDSSPEALAKAVERFAAKPPAAAITIDNKGNLYIGDIEARAIGIIDADTKEYRILAADPRLVWPDGLCFGHDGNLFFFSRSEMALRPPGSLPVEAGQQGSHHSLYRMKPLAPGRPGD